MSGRDRARSVVTELVAAYNARDLAAIEARYRPDARYWSALADWRDGREAVLGHFRHLFDTLHDERMEAKLVVTDGTTVVVELVSTGSAPGGAPYRIQFTEVFELDGEGRVASAMAYIDPEDVAGIAS